MPSALKVLLGVRRRLAAGGGWPAGLTVLTGSDLYHLDGAQRALVEALVPAGEDAFVLTTFGEEPVSAGEIVGAARSMGMFAPRRVVLLRDVAALVLDTEARVEGACAAFSEYAASPPPGSHLLVRAPRLDSRRKFHKLLAQGEGTLVFEPPEGADLLEAVAAMAKERGIPLAADAAALLADLCADGDLYRAATELDKLGSWLGEHGGGKPVNAAMLAPLLAGGPGGSSFQVADAVVARDGAAAQRLTRQLLDDGENPLMFLGALAWRLRGLVQARAMLAARVPERAVMQATRLWNLEAVRRFRLEELLGFPAALLEADRGLKTGGEPRAVLQRLLSRLTEKA
ncbi:MAG TPA: DNA polymerase III subunit delta [Candidatus Polarisedimenticolaceae bacterium]|nr:DNA polymerase III subunit delta [Candidatus Polarisedimenticolaceae bacterium]